MILLLFLSLFMAFIPSASSQTAFDNLFEEFERLESSRIRDRLLDYDQREAQARQALIRSRNALLLAERLNDQQAVAVSRQAIATAEAALARIAGARQRDQERLRAFAQARAKLAETGTVERAREIALNTWWRGQLYRKTNGWGRVDRVNGYEPLQPADEVRTGANSYAEVIFSSGTTVQLGPESSFRFLRFDDIESVVEFIKGKLHIIVDCRKWPRKLRCGEMRIIHQGRTYSLRGTEFELDAPDMEPASLTVLEGAIEVTTKAPGKKINVTAGQRVQFRPDGTVRGPEQIDPSKVVHWWERN